MLCRCAFFEIIFPILQQKGQDGYTACSKWFTMGYGPHVEFQNDVQYNDPKSDITEKWSIERYFSFPSFLEGPAFAGAIETQFPFPENLTKNVVRLMNSAPKRKRFRRDPQKGSWWGGRGSHLFSKIAFCFQPWTDFDPQRSPRLEFWNLYYQFCIMFLSFPLVVHQYVSQWFPASLF